jgi:putative transposase
MPKAYSEDLRKRVMGFLKNGGSKAEAVRRFAVSKGSVARWEKRLRETGKVAAHTQGRKRGVSKVAAAALQDYVTAHPDQNLIEIGEHFGVSSVMIWKRLKQIGFTFKKRAFSTRSAAKKSAKSSGR